MLQHVKGKTLPKTTTQRNNAHSLYLSTQIQLRSNLRRPWTRRLAALELGSSISTWHQHGIMISIIGDVSRTAFEEHRQAKALEHAFRLCSCPFNGPPLYTRTHLTRAYAYVYSKTRHTNFNHMAKYPHARVHKHTFHNTPPHDGMLK